MGTKEKYGKWAKSFHAAVSSRDQKIGLTLEEYLGNDLRYWIGPFVALGSPQDYLAPPGALRVYAKDDEWKDKFDALAQRAAAIIVEVSKSDNLRWEFEHLRSEGLQDKLFVLTRPSMEGSKFAWAFWGAVWRVKGIRTMKRQEFCSDVGKLGYRVNLADPGHGVVLGFDRASEAFVLTAEAQWPTDFVQPIRAWVKERRRIGRCLESACTNCGRTLYVTTSERRLLCADCALSTSPTKRVLIRTGLWVGALLILFLPIIVGYSRCCSQSCPNGSISSVDWRPRLLGKSRIGLAPPAASQENAGMISLTAAGKHKSLPPVAAGSLGLRRLLLPRPQLRPPRSLSSGDLPAR